MAIRMFFISISLVFYCCSQVFGAEPIHDLLSIDRTYTDMMISYVKDGDSLVIKHGDFRFHIRLWGIDSPEYDQPHAHASKTILKQLVFNKKISITVKDRDKYGRYVVIAHCGNSTINRELIAAGAAWVHRYYCRESVCDEWLDLEKSALRNKIGLWKYDDPIEPWVWKQSR